VLFLALIVYSLQLLPTITMEVLLTSLAGGELNLITELIWIFIATVLSMIGGALGGMLLAGRDLGYEFSAILGALLGPAGVIPAMVLSFALLSIFRSF